MDLGICPIGSAVEVRWVDLHDDERARLRELGIREGAILHVVDCGAFGARVVAIGADRFAIDGRTCACIAVIPHALGGAVIGSQELLNASPSTAEPEETPTRHDPARRLHLAKPKGAAPEGDPTRRPRLSKPKGEVELANAMLTSEGDPA